MSDRWIIRTGEGPRPVIDPNPAEAKRKLEVVREKARKFAAKVRMEDE